jgi:bifunctional DNA-binding transcriptional regulator/antitoxin component of YhaV-PrlF toxin-antitoxin module
MTESTVVVDSKYRVVLEKRVRAAAGIVKGERLVAVPFAGGVILASAAGKRFAGSLDNVRFREEDHEADRFLAKLTKSDADN